MRKHLTHIVITSIVALAAVPVSAVAVAAAASGIPSTSARAASVGTPRCSAAQLRLSRIDQQGALGTTYWDMALRNVGRSACHMRGYPGVGLLDPDSRLRAADHPAERVSADRVPSQAIRGLHASSAVGNPQVLPLRTGLGV